MDMLCHQCIFCCFTYSILTLLKTFFNKIFSPADDLKLKLVANNQKINVTKEIFLFVLSLLFLYIYIYIYIADGCLRQLHIYSMTQDLKYWI